MARILRGTVPFKINDLYAWHRIDALRVAKGFPDVVKDTSRDILPVEVD